MKSKEEYLEQNRRQMETALAEVTDAEERARQERIKIEKYLDQMDLERLEWQRLQHDMYPGTPKPEQEED